MTQQHSENRKRGQERGFALIVTLSLMVLLAVIAVGLLTLSSISLRSTSRTAAQSVAKANAKLALMIAIGELQKALGPDQRISANASVVLRDAEQPNVVGAWDGFGWQGPSGDAPDPGDKAAKFRSWLVSTPDPAERMNVNLPTIANGEDGVWLSNPQTTGMIQSPGYPEASNTKMFARRVPVSGGTKRGGFAWMVTDNSVGVSVNLHAEHSEELAVNVANRTAALSPRPDVISEGSADPEGLQDLKKLANRRSLVSLQTAVLALGGSPESAKAINARSRSLTTSSVGLLTDPVNGGLKMDLTPLLEAGSGNNPDGAADDESPYFDPNWGAPTWAYLRNHYQKYRNITYTGASMPRYDMTPGGKGADDVDPTKADPSGFNKAPATETLLPVLAKLQIVFSMVTHYSHISDRITALQNYGSPRGNNYHAVPHLVYDPVVTLYNPYDVELDLSKVRIRIWDPPVGFQFQKHDMQAKTDAWLRDDFSRGEYQGLARFQRVNEKNKDARRTFTLILQNMNSEGSSLGSLVLAPGEVRVFSPRVESGWTWGKETAGGYNVKTFFDFENRNDFGNRDGRNPAALGVESIPGLELRAGLQVDHLAYEGSSRPRNSLYAFEFVDAARTQVRNPFGGGWVTMRSGIDKAPAGSAYMSDEITVNCKPVRTVVDRRLPDFQVDVLAGVKSDVSQDLLRSYVFRMGDLASELSTTGNAAQPISQRFRVLDLLQKPGDTNLVGKTPFALFTMAAKTTKDSRDDSKAWLFNNLVTAGALHESGPVGNAAQSYDLSLKQVSDFNDMPFDPVTGRGYFGALDDAQDGVTAAPMYRIPLTPAASLGDWISSNLVSSSKLPRVNYPLGNSYAHPLVASDAITQNSPVAAGEQLLDHSYLLNAALWDRYYFSSAANYDAGIFSNKRSRQEVLEEFFSGVAPMLNSRLKPYLTGAGDAATVAGQYDGMSPDEFSSKFASNAVIDGAFNINSDSVDAWRAVLSSMRDASVAGFSKAKDDGWEVNERTAFPRTGLTIGGDADSPNPRTSTNVIGAIPWACFRTLDDDQIRKLAISIVTQIRLRGTQDGAPSLCLADFINRRVGSASELHAQKGILQTAIDEAGVNKDFLDEYSNPVSAGSLSSNRTRGLANKEALEGQTAEGAAPVLTQGDLLTALAPIMTARGDTFTIRAYGEARDAAGKVVEARAWCEATLQRVPEYVDPTNRADSPPAHLSQTNLNFGRRFTIMSFRWLNASEI